MRSPYWSFLATLMALGPIGMPRPARAQLIPGGRSVDVDAQRAQFNDVTLKAIRPAIDAWQAGWPIASTPNRIIDQYGENPTVVQVGGPLISGQVAVRAMTDSLRVRIREATLALSDFEASEGIAYLYGPLVLEPRDAASPSMSGHHLTVLKREAGGYRIRAQVLAAPEGGGTLPRLPASHPSGPLTVQAMAQRATPARFRNANDMLNNLHVAWSRSDTTALFGLLAGNALVHLPDEMGTTGQDARRALSNALNRTGELHMVTLDYDGAGRLLMLVGRYYLGLDNGSSRDGYFGLVLGEENGILKVRALMFT
jgi:hypothetical protein